MARLPAVFVSHGAPTMILEPVAAREFLRELGVQLGRPSAILVVSAHWEASHPAVSSAAQPETIHDFYGFPAELYAMRYPAPGAPDLARRVADLVSDAGYIAHIHPTRGLDHGAWVPLMLMYPQADIPVTQLSVHPHGGAEYHYQLGQALRALRDDGVLILGSGSTTHNLSEFRGHRRDDEAPAWVEEFREWLRAAVEDGRVEELLAYRDKAPGAARNHPSEEHLLPLFVALGAGSAGVPGKRTHRSTTYGVLAMDAYAFD